MPKSLQSYTQANDHLRQDKAFRERFAALVNQQKHLGAPFKGSNIKISVDKKGRCFIKEKMKFGRRMQFKIEPADLDRLLGAAFGIANREAGIPFTATAQPVKPVQSPPQQVYGVVPTKRPLPPTPTYDIPDFEPKGYTQIKPPKYDIPDFEPKGYTQIKPPEYDVPDFKGYNPLILPQTRAPVLGYHRSAYTMVYPDQIQRLESRLKQIEPVQLQSLLLPFQVDTGGIKINDKAAFDGVDITIQKNGDQVKALAISIYLEGETKPTRVLVKPEEMKKLLTDAEALTPTTPRVQQNLR